MTQQKPRFLDSSTASPTFIGADSVFVGDIRGKGQFVVSGEVHGDGELDGALNLSAGGAWHGQVRAQQAIERFGIEDLLAARHPFHSVEEAIRAWRGQTDADQSPG